MSRFECECLEWVSWACSGGGIGHNKKSEAPNSGKVKAVRREMQDLQEVAKDVSSSSKS